MRQRLGLCLFLAACVSAVCGDATGQGLPGGRNAAPAPRPAAAPPSSKVAPPPAPVTLSMSPTPWSAPPSGAECRRGCDQAYYFCRAGDHADDCDAPWGQCLSGCLAPSLAAALPPSP